MQALVDGLTAEAPSGAAVLSVGRATLAPGQRLAWAAAAGPVLVHVEDGAAGLDSGAGTAWVRSGAAGRSVTLGGEPPAVGRGVLVAAGNGVEVRAGPHAPAHRPRSIVSR